SRGAYYMAAGAVKHRHKDYAGAIANFTQAISLKPNFIRAYCARGEAFSQTGAYVRASADLTQALNLGPNDANANNNMAWLLATCPVESIRNGTRAIGLATKACQLSNWDPNYEDTLAAAYAEAGRYSEAVLWQNKAVHNPAAPQSEMGNFQARLLLYEHNL